MNEIRVFSIACVIGGLLRIVSSFVDYETAPESVEILYMAIDLSLILGLIGFYSVFRPNLSWLGHLGFMISICGFAIIAGPETDLFGVGIYQIGSPIVGIGVLLLSIHLIQTKVCGLAAPILLISSVLLGLGSMAVSSSLLFTGTGILFGMGFVVLGTKVWSSSGHRV